MNIHHFRIGALALELLVKLKLVLAFFAPLLTAAFLLIVGQICASLWGVPMPQRMVSEANLEYT